MAHSKPSAKNATSEYATFENALKKVLSVSHATIRAELEAEKRKKTKRSSVSHAANAKS